MEKEDFIKRFNEIQENSNKKIIVFINRCSKVNLNYQMNYINNVNLNKKKEIIKQYLEKMIYLNIEKIE